MKEIDRMISANVQVKRATSYPEMLGLFRFFALPRIGEVIHLTANQNEQSLKVVAVDYCGYADDEHTFNVGDTLLTCEEISA